MILLSLNSELKLKCNRYTFFFLVCVSYKVQQFLSAISFMHPCFRFGPAKVMYEIIPEESKVASSSVVSVDNEGNLLASSKPGSATLMVTAVEECGVVQRLSVIVKVCFKIQYLFLHLIFRFCLRIIKIKSLCWGGGAIDICRIWQMQTCRQHFITVVRTKPQRQQTHFSHDPAES